MQWVGRIARAVEEGRLELFAQRIVPITTTGVDAPFFELMVRLRDEDGTLVPPSEFIPAAERYNVMVMVDRWVVGRAIELLEGCLRTHARLPLLAINISGTSINDEDFLDFVFDAACQRSRGARPVFRDHRDRRGGLAGQGKVLHARTQGARLSLLARRLRQRRVVIRLLKSLPVDFLKIDGHFAAHVVADPVDRSMVEAITKIGRAMQVATIAREGRECRGAGGAQGNRVWTTSRAFIWPSPPRSRKFSAAVTDASIFDRHTRRHAEAGKR